ncbi:hypothetical protein N7478_002122 [Penicillium angulare]|uniref:uncharacterized protein n=1 Tax=Penicillium angulare TaxID=116970 RepID=UPI0025407CE3|nr:uncharacterized protein N7478_002122 [Penicillium angulare]KAJ5289092.1 hypothetical protein N7478_002122 [Penicillium angulare]
MSTRFSQDDKYRDEIIQMEDEKYGAGHHRHVNHDFDSRSEEADMGQGPYRVAHRQPQGRRSPTTSNKAKGSSGSAAKRHDQSKNTRTTHHHPQSDVPDVPGE